MRSYLLTTGAVFGLLTILHAWMAIAEWPVRSRDPWFMLTTVLSAALFVWALRLLRTHASRGR